jgi:NADH dehydrogenase/NADH:ubiquinone oxidoreductase subunit G
LSARTIELNVDRPVNERTVQVTVDDQEVSVPEGSTLLDACRALSIDTPTLCYGETLEPANACRVCMVELQGARTLVPACSRKAEDGMVVKTDSERVRLNRRIVLELLASSVDLSTTPGFEVYLS